MWVLGSPGTGKSYLSTRTIRTLKDMYPQDFSHPSRTSVAYLYIKEDDQDLRDLNNVLKGIAYQITLVDSVYRKHTLSVSSTVERLYSARLTWQRLFLEFFGPDRALTNTAFIVIDGVDEATQESLEQLFQILEDLIPPTSLSHPMRLMVAIFGRPEIAQYIPVGSRLSRSLRKIEVGRNNEKDIEKYIKKHVSDVQLVQERRRKKSQASARQLKQQILDQVLAKADGMFFKVVLIMKDIQGKESQSKVFEAIQKVPPRLNTMIQHVFERLSQDEDVGKDYLNEILLWVAFAKRPLTIGELYVICKLHSGEANEVLENRLRNKFASILKLTGPALEEDSELASESSWDSDEVVTEKNEQTTRDVSGDPIYDRLAVTNSEQDDQMTSTAILRFQKTVVQYAHVSIRDFLVKQGNSQLAHVGISIDPTTAEFHLFSTCLQVLTKQGEFGFYDRENEQLNLEDYAVEFFLDHLMAIECSTPSLPEYRSLLASMQALFESSEGMQLLLEMAKNMNLEEKYLRNFLGENGLLKKLRRLHEMLAKQFPTDSKDLVWLQRAIKQPQKFFEPLCDAAFDLWFGDRGAGYSNDHSSRHKHLFEICILHGCLAMVRYSTFFSSCEPCVKMTARAQCRPMLGGPDSYNSSR